MLSLPIVYAVATAYYNSSTVATGKMSNMATTPTQIRIPLETKELLKKKAKEQGYKSLSAFIIATCLASTGKDCSYTDKSVIDYKAALIERYGMDKGRMYYQALRGDTAKMDSMLWIVWINPPFKYEGTPYLTGYISRERRPAFSV